MKTILYAACTISFIASCSQPNAKVPEQTTAPANTSLEYKNINQPNAPTNLLYTLPWMDPTVRMSMEGC